LKHLGILVECPTQDVLLDDVFDRFALVIGLIPPVIAKSAWVKFSHQPCDNALVCLDVHIIEL